MNILTKQRYISTSIWSDDWFDSLSEREKLVYFYLLTNEHTNAAGVYSCTLKNVRLEIGLDRAEIERIMAKFEAAGKAFYYHDYIIIPKWLKHQKISERSKMFLGAIAVFKALPADIRLFIEDRRHYDFDIQKYIETPSGDNLSIAYPEKSPENDSLSPKNDRLSPKTDSLSIAYPENATFSSHDSDSDSDSDLDSEFNINIQQKKTDSLSDFPDEPNLAAYFINRWQQNADVFNCLARLKRPSDWTAFWEQNTMSIEQIDLAIDNFIEGVKTGAIERRYIPSSPDGFVLNGWITRSLGQFKKQGQRIGNDSAVEDLDKYFRET
jgi:hypothetical protein